MDISNKDIEYNTTVVLKSLLMNTLQCNNLTYLEDVFLNEDYILYFYIREYASRGVDVVTDKSLQLVMSNNAIRWIQPQSILNKYLNNKGNVKIATEYIASRTSELLTSQADYARVLTKLVLDRYNEVMKINIPNDEKEIQSLLEGIKIKAKSDYSIKIIENVVNLIQGNLNSALVGKVKFNSSDVLEYMINASNEALMKLNASYYTNNSIKNLSEITLDMLANDNNSTEVTFKWNLGNDILDDPMPGWLITITADKKAGKTRFTLGEIVYSTMCNKKNVKYYSGEMSPTELVTLLVIKHLYTTKAINYSQKKYYKMVSDILVISKKILNKTATVKQIEQFKSYEKSHVQIVLEAEYDLFRSGKYGGIKIVHQGFDSSSKNQDDKQFVIENLETTMLSELNKLDEILRYDLVIFDHAGHFISSTGKTKTDILTELYQKAKSLANNRVHAFTSVVINHINTKQADSINKMKQFDGEGFRAHGTSEAGKSADIDLSFAATMDQKRDGIVSLIVNDSRHTNYMEKYNTNTFPMIANRGVCDFAFQGCTKTNYC